MWLTLLFLRSGWPIGLVEYTNHEQDGERDRGGGGERKGNDRNERKERKREDEGLEETMI